MRKKSPSPVDVLTDSILWLLVGCLAVTAILWGSTILMQVTGQR